MLQNPCKWEARVAQHIQAVEQNSTSWWETEAHTWQWGKLRRDQAEQVWAKGLEKGLQNKEQKIKGCLRSFKK